MAVPALDVDVPIMFTPSLKVTVAFAGVPPKELIVAVKVTD